MRHLQKRKVVVTGLGLATSLGLELDTNWDRVLAGVSGVKKISYPGTQKSPVRAVAEVSKADFARIEEKFKEESACEGERRTLFALWSAESALRNSGALDADINRKRFGVSLAAGLGINRPEDIQKWLGHDRTFDYAAFGQGYKGMHKESIVRNNSNRPASLIAQRYGLTGFNSTITTACASATQAIGTGYRA